MKKLTSELIKNELIDFLELNSVLFIEGEYSVDILHPKLGKCTYWIKRNKLHIHKPVKWVDSGFYFLKKSL